MSKDELEQLIKQFASLADKYQHYLSVKNSFAPGTVDDKNEKELEQIPNMKIKLEGLLEEWDKPLSESVRAANERLVNSYQSNVVRCERILTTQQNKLKQAHPELDSDLPGLLTKQKQYNELLNILNAPAYLPHVSELYHRDTRLGDDYRTMRQYEEETNKFIEKNTSSMNRPVKKGDLTANLAAKEREYTASIEVLNSHLTRRQEHLKKIKDRIDSLGSAQHAHQQALNGREQLIREAQQLLTSEQLAKAKQLDLESRRSLTAVIEHLQQQVERVAKDYPLEAGDLEEQMRKLPSAMEGLQQAIQGLKKKIAEIEQDETKKQEASLQQEQEKLEKQISQQQEMFDHLYETIMKELENTPQFKGPIEELRTLFQKEHAGENTANEPQIVFVNKKLQALSAITEQLRNRVSAQKQRVLSHTQERINLVRQALQSNYKASQEKLQQHPGYIFSEEEQELISAIKEPVINEKQGGTKEALTAELQDLENQLSALQKAITSVNDLLALHKKAKEINDDGALANAINAINDKNKNTPPLSLLGKYREDLLEKINSLIQDGLLNVDGRAAVKSFIANKSGETVGSIEEKLVFIKVLKEKFRVDNYKDYLSQTDLLLVAVVIEKNKLIVPVETLSRDDFRKAVLVLHKQHQIPFTQELLDALVASPERCNLVIQHNAQGEGFLPAKELGILLTKIARADIDVVNAMNAINQQKPNLCHPGAFMFITLSPVLKNLLNRNQDEVKKYFPFLETILDSPVYKAYLKNALSGSDNEKQLAEEYFQRELDKNNKMLDALGKAAPDKLKELNDFMQGLKELVRKNPSIKTAASRFYQEAIPLFLSKDSSDLVLTRKKILDSATTHFEKSGYWGEIKRWIFNKLEKYFPERLAKHIHSFFSAPMAMVRNALKPSKEAPAEEANRTDGPSGS